MVKLSDLPAIDLSKLEMPKFEMPKFEMPKFDVPQVPGVDAERIAGFARDAAYAVIGAGTLAAQALQERREELAARVEAFTTATRARVEALASTARAQVEGVLRDAA